jgi:hypothetical protein
MKRYFYFFLLIVSGFTLKSQNVFAPIGSTWNYTWYEHSGAYHGPRTLYYTGDTIISSITYKKIASAYVYSCFCPNWQTGSYYYDYIHESNDSVFSANPGSALPMQLLYAFNQPIGDSILFNIGMTGFQYKIVLDSIETQFICNQNRRVLFYTKYENGCTDTTRIIEGIGPINDYLFLQGIGNCELGNGQFTFNCANITTCSYPSSCSPAAPLAIKEINSREPAIKAYQTNETETLLFNTFLSGELVLKDVLGRNQIFLSFKDSEKINFSAAGLNTGIYFVSLKTDEGEFCKKIMIE